MPATWVEIWGRERGEATQQLLYKFPFSQFDSAFRELILKDLADDGTTAVEIRTIEEEEDKPLPRERRGWTCALCHAHNPLRRSTCRRCGKKKT